jgi:hypothetical protein
MRIVVFRRDKARALAVGTLRRKLGKKRFGYVCGVAATVFKPLTD